MTDEYNPCTACGATKGHYDTCPRMIAAKGPFVTDDMPDSPMTPVEVTGAEFFNVYVANLKAGFTSAQSLYLLAVQMSGNPGIAPTFGTGDEDGG